MAKSKFEYVRNYEQDDRCLLNTWIVVRIDGRAFHRFSKEHCFNKPNDISALNLMNKCAVSVLNEFQDIVIAYGQSDEYSFVFKKSTTLFKRRTSKIISTVVSYFASCYVFHWNEFMKTPLLYPPTFDGRIILYPTAKEVRDYLSWRQVDCHINNLYNTCYWGLVTMSGLKPEDAESTLRVEGNTSSEKQELLYQRFGINYNNEPDQYKKGSVLIWKEYIEQVCTQSADIVETCDHETETDRSPLCNQKQQKGIKCYRKRKRVTCCHVDVIAERFWEEHNDVITND